MPYIYSIRDTKAESFDLPFSAVNSTVAVRMFSDLVSRQDNLVGQHPEDFELYQLAYFDQATGLFKASPVSRDGHEQIPVEWSPQLIATASAIKAALTKPAD